MTECLSKDTKCTNRSLSKATMCNNDSVCVLKTKMELNVQQTAAIRDALIQILLNFV